jgi:hypothetical protein
MPSITVFRGDDGKLAGFGEKGGRAMAKFKRTVDSLEAGQTLTFSFKLPRSPVHHRFFFWKINGLFKRQEKFVDDKWMRDWLTMGAGFCDLMAGADGAPMMMPRSLNFDDMDEAEFVELHRQINDYLWTDRAQAFLWPHLSAVQRHDMVEQWHKDFR